jgi:peptide subunit release factor 1 (eRF1)
MVNFLSNIEQFNEPSAFSIYIPRGLPSPEIEYSLSSIRIHPLPTNLNQLIISSQNGAALYWGNNGKYLVFPPFPLKDQQICTGYTTQPLRQLVTCDYIIGLLLLHLGSYAIGICRGEELISSKVGTGLIHGRHKKGGSSQQRFQRRRENQIREFLDRVCLHIKKHFENYTDNIDYIVYGGPHQTLLQLRKRCSFLQVFSNRVIATINVPTLRQRTLETSITRIWSTSIIEWQDE